MENKTVKLIFDGEYVEAVCEIDSYGEYVCKTEDGRFLKFPKTQDLDSEVKKHNEANK